VDMIGHQHIGMNFYAVLVRRRLEPTQIGAVIPLTSKNRLPIIAPLNHVLRHTGQFISW